MARTTGNEAFSRSIISAPSVPSYHSIEQRESEHHQRHDSVHREEGGVEMAEISRSNQLMLVDQNTGGDDESNIVPRSKAGRVPEHRQRRNRESVQCLAQQNGAGLAQPNRSAPEPV